MRQELVRRLGDGQTAVWLLLECGRPADDDAAAKVVEDELKKLKEDLKLPELTDSPDDSILAGVPLRLDFSLLRIHRSDMKEQPLVNMLVQSESDLLERDDPMVFPVFGRGRALFPLVGAGITADNVRDSAAFLTGACSCEVKEQNPGFDLLLKTDWESLFIRDEATAAVLASREAKVSTTPQLVAIPPGSSASDSTASDASPAPNRNRSQRRTVVFPRMPRNSGNSRWCSLASPRSAFLRRSPSSSDVVCEPKHEPSTEGLLRWLILFAGQRHPRAVLIAARAAGRGVGHQHQAADRQGVDPAAGPDAAEVLDARAARQVEVAERRRAEEHHVLRAGELPAAVGALQLERRSSPVSRSHAPPWA